MVSRELQAGKEFFSLCRAIIDGMFEDIRKFDERPTEENLLLLQDVERTLLKYNRSWLDGICCLAKLETKTVIEAVNKELTLVKIKHKLE